MRFTPHLLAVAVLVLASPAAHCGDSASIQGQSARYSVSFQDPIADRDSVIETMGWDENYGPGGGGYGKHLSSIKFWSECKATKTKIECRGNGKTPLAGATFRLTYDGTATCEGAVSDARFTCVKGCTKKVPRYLSINPYEC